MQDFDSFKLRNYLLRYNQTEFSYDKLHNLEDFDFGSFNLTGFTKEYDLSRLDLGRDQLDKEQEMQFNMTAFIEDRYGEFYLDFSKIDE